jgi:hypothetical protein
MKIKLILAGLAIAALIGSNGCGKAYLDKPSNGTNDDQTASGSHASNAVVVPFSNTSGRPGLIAAAAGYHNPGMNYVYNSLQSSWGTTDITSTQVANQFVNTVVSTTQGYFNVTFGLTNYNINIFGSNYKLFNAATNSIPSYIQTQTGVGLSFAVSTGLNSLETIIEQNNDPTSISSACNSLVSTILPTLNTTSDTILFLGAVDVAINSASYWYSSSNLSMWQAYSVNITGPSPFATTFGHDPENGHGNGAVIKEAIFSDVVGAGIGAVRGALVGGAGGTVVVPGVGTLTGAAAGGLWGMASGAVMASVGDGVKAAVRKWLNW